jgi:hypothetical protein
MSKLPTFIDINIRPDVFAFPDHPTCLSPDGRPDEVRDLDRMRV